MRKIAQYTNTIGAILGFLIMLISSCQKLSASDVERNIQSNIKTVTETSTETHGNSAATQQQVSIVRPAEGSRVCMRTSVSGSVSDPSLQVYVLIHPMATNRFWVQPIPNMNPDGTWEAYCYFGESDRGIGEPFEIIVVASRNRNLFREGDTLPSPLQDNTQILLKSKLIRVTRAPCLH